MGYNIGVISPHAEPALPVDLPAALELLRREKLPEDGVDTQFERFVVVRDEARLVGVAGLEIHGEDGLLRSVVVDPQYRNEGVGGRLVGGCLAAAERAGLKAVYVLTTTARDYFLRKGFADCPRKEAPLPIRESWEYKSGCPSTAAFMRRWTQRK